MFIHLDHRDDKLEYTPTGVAINPSADAAHVNNHYYYDISRSGSVNATLKLKFAGLTEPGNSDKYVMHWNSGTSRWDQLTSTGATGYVTALATSFSPFGQVQEVVLANRPSIVQWGM